MKWPLGTPLEAIIEEEINRNGLYLPADGRWRLRKGVAERIAKRLRIGLIGEDEAERRRRIQRGLNQPTDMDDPDVLR